MSRIIHDICAITESAERPIAETATIRGWVLYDADCPFCERSTKRFAPLLARRNLKILPLQTPWVGARLGLENSQHLQEMRLLLPDGTNYGGADALIEIAGNYWWARPFCELARLSPVRKMLRRGYGWLAARRHCRDGACEIGNTPAREQHAAFADFLPLIILPCVVLAFRNCVEAWVFMWLMALALYAGCKWLTFRRAIRAGIKPNFPRSAAYLLAWPGMNATAFLDGKNQPAKPCGLEWTMAVVKTIFGAMLLWGITHTIFPGHPIVAGWMGMIGVVFILHFGLFHILALAWQQAGVAATPLMRNPILSRSLAEFWGRRWNTAFHELAFRLAFRPIHRVASAGIAMLLVFGLSGLVHDLLLSLPARGGYGLPTAYFLIQGAGLVVQRSKFGRNFALDRGVSGWLFTMLIAAGPAGLLFHRRFITHVILPMLARIDAI